MRLIPCRHPVRLILCLGAVTGLACDDASSPPPPGCSAELAATIELDPAGPLTLHRVQGGELIEVRVVSECGTTIAVAPEEVDWQSDAPSIAVAQPVPGAMSPLGFVRALGFGEATISATASGATADLTVQVVKPETEASGFTVLGSGDVAPYTTDLWVHGEVAYTGSQPWSCPGGSCEDVTGWLYVWSVPPDGAIEKVDSVALPAPKINDVKVSADGAFAVASLELGGASNGIVVLDLSSPVAPAIVAHYTAGLEGGVHNVWIERLANRDYVFVAVPGGDDRGLHVLDLDDRAAPVEVALFHAGSSLVHDVYVRDGLAFVSHWDAGLIILDVGNGMAGGSPESPVEVGRVETEGGNVHNAWYWPEGGVVFVGEEQFPPPDQIDQVGVMHVVDVSDMTAPVEVARFGVPGTTPHNFWLDEARGILYAAWYEEGLRAIDVTGELSGDLGAQGRELGYVLPSGVRGAPSIWAPQIHDGLIYLADIYNGIWAVRFDD